MSIIKVLDSHLIVQNEKVETENIVKEKSNLVSCVELKVSDKALISLMKKR